MIFVDCKRPRKSANGEQGQALLELLPVLSLLLLLTFGVIECSYAIWQLEVITALTREGSNLASRNTTLAASASTVITDGAVLNLATNGKVIVTAVQNQSGTFVITGQATSGNLIASSRIGSLTGPVTIPATPATSTSIPLNGSVPLNSTVYVTEVFTKYTPITPLGAFVRITMSSTLYDVAYF